MSLSLNEVDALARKATRGAGYPWGFAEEASKAVRGLCAHGFDGCAVLADSLAQTDGRDLSQIMPRPGAVWKAPGGLLCPIAAGAALLDHLDVRFPLQLEQVVQPLLLAPFALAMARALERGVCLAWEDTRLTTDGAALVLCGPAGASRVSSVELSLVPVPVQGTPRPQTTRATPDAEALDRLHRLAARTYAPATEASRVSGAGAGLSDND